MKIQHSSVFANVRPGRIWTCVRWPFGAKMSSRKLNVLYSDAVRSSSSDEDVLKLCKVKILNF